jgi:methylenetetrahydrofolate--tRNA-(uracil-5-)-methyltransferase
MESLEIRMPDSTITIIGGGLAGTEAAWQAARRGITTILYEMRPRVPTAAHQSDKMAELVCSNSLKSNRIHTAPWLLKEEMRRTGSLLLKVAEDCAVPAGQALAVDRERFAAATTSAIEAERRIEVRREELREIPADGLVIVATGPLTSAALAESIQQVTGSERLYFYDAISPVVDAFTLDRGKVFPASRYGRDSETSSENPGDYLNCPFDEAEYQRFYDALIGAESVALHAFEDRNFFEGCLPLEELARRGRDTLRFGPMKPVGLTDPRTGRRPYAAVQLRQENLRADSYNLVGFQNHLKFGEQKRVLRLIPGLEGAEFLRYGQIHRNTYINAPALLNPALQLRSEPRIFFAGQLCGVEGYVESIATGMLAGIHAAGLAESGADPVAPPRATALGSLCHYITHADPENYQPANMAFDLLPPLCAATPAKIGRQERRAQQCQIALAKIDQWLRSEIDARSLDA